MNYTATYSPDDNKLRLYSVGRLPADVYARVKEAGFRWAPKQELFVAPAWTPGREDLLLELAGEIGDEDTSLADRAEQRAERFDEYSDKRATDADAARKAVSAISDNIPFGQPILVGHHSERHARRDAEKIENGMRRAVKMWETAQYWTGRAAGAIRHAKYKERPDVRARRIKGLEAEKRKVERSVAEAERGLKRWAVVDMPDKWNANEAGELPNREQRARIIANLEHLTVCRPADSPYGWTAWDVLRPDGERYEKCPAWTVDQILEIVRESYPRSIARCARWLAHLGNRLAYEHAMLGESGGTASDRKGPEKAGACRCWASPRGGWSYIQKVNQVSVTILDDHGNGGRKFTRTIPFDKLAALMTAAEVQAARDCGTLVHIDETGFVLRGSGHDAPQGAPAPAPKQETPDASQFDAMKAILKAGVQVVTAPQLFPTPRDLAQRVVDLADIRPGHRVLEPSAGTGALLGAMGGRMFGHNPDTGEVVAMEINAALAGRLQKEFPLTTVICADFLDCVGVEKLFDRIVMNPPFENSADIKHIQRALTFLKPGGRLVAICANGSRQREQLMPLADEWVDLDPGTFKVSGTGVNTALLLINKD